MARRSARPSTGGRTESARCVVGPGASVELRCRVVRRALVLLVGAGMLLGAPLARAGGHSDAPFARVPGEAHERAENAAPRAPEIERRRYVVAAIGDSLTDTRVGGGRYLAELRKRCPKSRFDAYGVGGQRTDHMRWRLTQDLFGVGLPRRLRKKKPHYTHVIIFGGVNDLLAGFLGGRARLRRTERNLSWMYRTAHKHGVKVIAMTVPPWGRLRGVVDRRVEATEALDAWMFKQKKLGKVDAVFDTYPLLSCGDPNVLCPRYRRFANDNIHWGRRGHKLIGHALFKQVFSDCE